MNILSKLSNNSESIGIEKHPQYYKNNGMRIYRKIQNEMDLASIANKCIKEACTRGKTTSYSVKKLLSKESRKAIKKEVNSQFDSSQERKMVTFYVIEEVATWLFAEVLRAECSDESHDHHVEFVKSLETVNYSKCTIIFSV